MPDAPRNGDHVPTALIGWWVDGIVWHLQRRFFGEIRLVVFRGRVMELRVEEVLTCDAKGDTTTTDAVGSWWLDKVQAAVARGGDLQVVLMSRGGAVRTVKVERTYHQADVAKGLLAICQ